MTPIVRKVLGVLAMVLIVWMCVAPFYYFGPGGDGVLDHLTLEDGNELLLMQRYNGNIGELYSIDFYVRLPGSSWLWGYIEHEDTRWTVGRLKYNPQHRSVEVYRGFWLIAAYFLDQQRFVLYDGGGREHGAPTKYRGPPLGKT